jgi:hypothetical protein
MHRYPVGDLNTVTVSTPQPATYPSKTSSPVNLHAMIRLDLLILRLQSLVFDTATGILFLREDKSHPPARPCLAPIPIDPPRTPELHRGTPPTHLTLGRDEQLVENGSICVEHTLHETWHSAHEWRHVLH